MKTSLLIILMCICFFINNKEEGQISKGGTPPSFLTKQITDTVHVIQMLKIDIDSIIQNDTTNTTLFRFGYAIDVDFGMDNSGTWDTLPNGDKIWRLTIRSGGAYSINLIYDDFWMPEGSQFFVYSEDKNMILGAFTSLNNKSHNKFSTDLVKGDAINLEYYEPVYVFGGRINVDKVIHGYKNLFFENRHDNTIYDCHFDIACTEGDAWCIEKRAVSVILTDENQAFCTGCLINNVRNDLTPYYLTANHCLNGDNDTWIFRFKYWSPTCNQGDEPFNWGSISGSSIRAHHADTDFALLELSVPPPSGFGVLYAGWDRTSSSPISSAVIHHPKGAMMKISSAESPATSSSYGGGSGDAHWQVILNKGTTEPASSGAPLFNQNHRIVGQNQGGNQGCPPVTKYYGRFDVSWNGGGTQQTRLRDWLDPDNTGTTSIGPTSPTIHLINSTLTSTNKFAALAEIHIEGNVETSGPICPTSDVPFTAESGSNIEIKAKRIVIKSGTHFKAGSNVTITAADNIECADNIVEGDYVDVFCNADISNKMMFADDNIFSKDSTNISDNFNEDISLIETKEKDAVNISENISLYPNPTNGSFIIEFADKKDCTAEIIIYNISGKIVFEKTNVSNDRIAVNICHLPKGVYIVQINRSKNTHTQKIFLR